MSYKRTEQSIGEVYNLSVYSKNFLRKQSFDDVCSCSCVGITVLSLLRPQVQLLWSDLSRSVLRFACWFNSHELSNWKMKTKSAKFIVFFIHEDQMKRTTSNCSIFFTSMKLNELKIIRGGSRTAATSKVELFVIIVNGFQSLTIITKRSTLDVAAVLDPPLIMKIENWKLNLNWNSVLTKETQT